MNAKTTKKKNQNVFIPEHDTMTRHEKMDFLRETTDTTFDKETILTELSSWMTEDDFSKFYDHVCSNWDVARSYEELNERYGE